MSARPRSLIYALFGLVPCVLMAQGQSRADLSRDLERLTKGERIAGVPAADSVSPGARSVPAGSTIHGTIVARGPVEVSGRVDGSVVSLAGSVTVRRGGVITGDALSVGGRVIADSGVVLGEMRSMAALPTLLGAAPMAVPVRSSAQRVTDAVRIVSVTFGVLLIIALGVLLFAGRNLDEVVATIEQRFARAFWLGVVGQVCLLPALALLIVALALSLIGILLIPFAIVAYAIACAGLLTLGFLAVARLVGGAVWHGSTGGGQSRALLALAIGIAMFFAVWMAAALFAWSPIAVGVLRAAALAATWAAITVGLGASLQSRAGTHRRVASAPRAVELAAWQTPTPVAGVVAARRHAAPAREGR